MGEATAQEDWMERADEADLEKQCKARGTGKQQRRATKETEVHLASTKTDTGCDVPDPSATGAKGSL